MVADPSGVAPLVVSVTVVVHVGVHDGATKFAVVPDGNPLALKLTDAAVPDSSVAVTPFVVAPPCTADTFPPLLIAKSNVAVGAFTVRLNVVVCTTAPLVPVTVMDAVPSGVVPDVVNVTVVVHVGVQDVGEKLAVVPAGNPLALNVTSAAVPVTNVAVTVLVVAPPCTADTFPPLLIAKSNAGGGTPPPTGVFISAWISATLSARL